MSSAARDVDSSRCSVNKREMFETFQTWALQNYGDSGKTKTVTRKKYDRIVKILTGEEPSTADNSKFRFWVKAKGFRLGPSENTGRGYKRTIYVPTKPVADPNCNDTDKDFKKVAKVEDFFDIIYNVHVDMDGRGGKHAGQKRTYRAIAETYAFLPREAVTRFLMSCSDCQKRMHMTTSDESHSVASCESTYKPDTAMEDPPIIDFTVPITQTYLNHMKQKGIAMDTGATDEAKTKSNRTDDQLKIRATNVVEHNVLFGKFSDKVSNEKRDGSVGGHCKTILSVIPQELISGVEGGVDTSTKSSPQSESLPSTSNVHVETSKRPTLSFIVQEVARDIDEEEDLTAASKETTACTCMSSKKGKTRNSQKELHDEEVDHMNELINIKKRRNEIEERKAVALERIAMALGKKFGL